MKLLQPQTNAKNVENLFLVVICVPIFLLQLMFADNAKLT